MTSSGKNGLNIRTNAFKMSYILIRFFFVSVINDILTHTFFFREYMHISNVLFMGNFLALTACYSEAGCQGALAGCQQATCRDFRCQCAVGVNQIHVY